MKRRALVLSNESAGHWLRRSLPAHVLHVSSAEREAVAGAALADTKAAQAWKMSGGDWKSFATSYSACLVAILTFIM
ncbi:hypothetical protein [Novosphingobium aureum]|nr:hypothetical protein [Novosphingobium aureum]